jgi:hypothetical protein
VGRGEWKLKKEEGYSFFVHNWKTLYVRRTVDLGRIHICHLVALFVLNHRNFPCALYNPVSVSYNLKPNPKQCVLCVSEPYIHSVPPYLTGLRIAPYFRVKAQKLKPTNYHLFRKFLLIFFSLLHQCFSTAGTGRWHQLYRAARGSPGICHFSFLNIFHE